MKNSNYWRIRHRYLYGVMLALVALCFVACKDDDGQDEPAFDPDRPIVVSNFLPEGGGAGSRLVVYGDNFGNDASKVRVTIGGKQATIITVKNKSLYCFVPAKAYDGDIEVSILGEDGEEIAYVEAEKRFTYQKKMLVSSLLGEVKTNNNDFDVKDGPFEDCGGLEKMEWLAFDPLNPNHLYVAAYEKSCRLIDFENKYVSTFIPGIPGNHQVPYIGFTMSGDMIVTHDQGSDTQPGNYLLTRSSGFKEKVALWNARGCRTAAVHPQNGECYYAFYNTGLIWRGDIASKTSSSIFRLPNSNVRVFIIIHPTGKYAYFIVNSRHYIMRSDYNWEKSTFTEPYMIAGKDNTAAYVDGVGSNSRLNEPQQGVFVKNPDYTGQDDEYDFYFCDKKNQTVRVITPQGKVSTFAGIPLTVGYRNGDLRLDALFEYPAGITYDEKRQCFYVGDSNNRRIRKIALEE